MQARLAGGIRIRQVRSRVAPCQIPGALKQVYGKVQECSSPYSSDTRERSPIVDDLTPLQNFTLPFQYQDYGQLNTSSWYWQVSLELLASLEFMLLFCGCGILLESISRPLSWGFRLDSTADKHTSFVLASRLMKLYAWKTGGDFERFTTKVHTTDALTSQKLSLYTA